MPDLSAPLDALDDRLDAIKRRLRGRLGPVEPYRVLPFRGFGTAEWLWLRGRVLEEEGLAQVEDGTILENLLAMLKRYESDEVAGAEVEVRLGERRLTTRTDDEGYFELEVDELVEGEMSAPWTRLELRLLSPLVEGQDNPAVEGWVRVPGEGVRLGIVSDLDDTVVKTGATDILRHARTVLLDNAQSREPFPGVAALYQSLVDGAAGDEDNPLFYVSSSPWNVYDLLEGFLELHEVPLGPILLKDFGVDRGKILKSGHVGYKAERIAHILDTYPDLPFLFLGDSGQQDAWVVEEVVRRRPGRVLAAYLRDLNAEKPDPEIAEIEERVAKQGVPMLRASDSATMAEHACEQGWISEEQLAAIPRE